MSSVRAVRESADYAGLTKSTVYIHPTRDMTIGPPCNTVSCTRARCTDYPQHSTLSPDLCSLSTAALQILDPNPTARDPTDALNSTAPMQTVSKAGAYSCNCAAPGTSDLSALSRHHRHHLDDGVLALRGDAHRLQEGERRVEELLLFGVCRR